MQHFIIALLTLFYTGFWGISPRTSTEVQYPRPIDIPTIPEIFIIIQISFRVWFQKGMSLYVCSNIPEILNIPNIPDIPNISDIPEFPLFLKLLSRSNTMQNLEVIG